MLREIPETAVLSTRNEPAFLFSPHLLLIRLPMQDLLQLILEKERLRGIAHLLRSLLLLGVSHNLKFRREFPELAWNLHLERSVKYSIW